VFGLPTFRVGRIFGIPLEIDPTWLIVFVLVAASLSFSHYPTAFPGRAPIVDLVSGVLTALLFFASIVAHEMSHSLVARAGGMGISRVTLFVFGGVAQMEDEPSSPSREFLMAAAGPGMSLVLAALFGLGATWLYVLEAPDVIWGPFEYLALINLWVALFNLLPGFPLDGGRVLRAALWAITGDALKATRWASRSGRLIGYSLVAVAVFGVLRGTLDFVWFGLIGWFIASLADSAYRQQLARTRLHAVRVSQIMSPDPVIVSGALTLDELLHRYIVGGSHTKYPVAVDGAVVGLVTLEDVRAVPSGLWTQTLVRDVADKDLGRIVVAASAPADTALERLASDGPAALFVVEQGKVVGIVTRADALARTARAAGERDHR
jgi:Zn-dependent protease/CBS domain-containing protein